MNQVIDFSTLSWVKKELDETLKEARQSLQAHVENPEDEAQLGFLAAYLHQVCGTLQMVELYGASTLAQEMEQVAKAMVADSLSGREEACEVLMRAILQLPDYLDRLISGGRDITLVLLPLVNDLRVVRGDSPLSEDFMFSPDLKAELPASVAGKKSEGDFQKQAKDLRHRFQLGLLGWFKGNKTGAALESMASVLASLQQISSSDHAARLWWVAAGLVDALKEEALETSVAIKRLMGQVDLQIKSVADHGEDALDEDVSEELLKSLLLHVGRARNAGPRVAEIQSTFRLQELLPSEEEVRAARESLSGQNADLYETVAIAVREELARLKDALDIILRNGCKNLRELEPLIVSLRSLGDTLGMLGLSEPREAVFAKAEDLQQFVEAGEVPANTLLMDVASVLLFVESSVEGMGSNHAVDNSDGSIEGQLAESEFNQVMNVVMQEAITDLTRAKEAVVAYIESNSDAENLAEVPQLFSQVKGGLALVGETRAAALLDSIARYVQGDLLQRDEPPPQHELDSLADAVCGVEYYLESRREHRGYGGSAMVMAEESVDKLGYPTQPTDEADAAAGLETAQENLGGSSEAHADDPNAPLSQEQDEFGVTAGEQEPEAEEIPSGEQLEGEAGPVSLSEDVLTGESVAEPVEDGMEAVPPGDEFPQDAGEAVYAQGLEAAEITSVEQLVDEAGLELSMSEDEMPDDIVAEGVTDGADRVLVDQEHHEDTGIEEFQPQPVEEPAASSMEAVASAGHGSEAAVSAQAAEEDDGLDIIGDEVDEEILEIFIEEAEEEFANINEQLPVWIRDTDASDALGSIRRSYHTLKGSGRLVGAMRIGEFAWRFENLLNRVIDGTVSLGPEMVDLLRSASDALPELVQQVKDGTPTQQPIGHLMECADALSRGESLPATQTVDAEPAAHEVQEESTDGQLETGSSVPDKVSADEQLEPEIEAPDRVASEVESEPEAAVDDGLMDPMLYDIFNCETQGHLEVIRQFLNRDAVTDAMIDEPLARAVHTLHGSAHMAEADAIAVLAGELERWTKALLAAGQAMPVEDRKVLDESAGMIEQMLSGLPQELIKPEGYDGVLAQVRSLYESVPAAAADETLTEMVEAEAIAEHEEVTSAETSEVEPPAEAEDATPAEMAEAEALVETEDTTLAEMAEVEAFAEAEDATPVEMIEVETHVEAEDAASAEILEVEACAKPDAESEMQSRSEEVSETASDHGDPYADCDEELLDIFLEESAENLEASDAALHRWRESADDVEALAELQRALHTLKGGARMADLIPIGDLAHAVESLIIEIAEGRAGASDGAMDGLQQAQDNLAHMLDCVRNRTPLEPASVLITRLDGLKEHHPVSVDDAPQQQLAEAALADTDTDQAPEGEPLAETESRLQPSPEDPYADTDPELLDVFLEEAGDIMEHTEQTLQAWKSAPGDQSLMTELQRELHTLKGGARMADITAIGDLAHAVESLMVRVAGGEINVSEATFAVLEQAHDSLSGMVELVSKHQPLTAASEIVANLESLVEGKGVVVQSSMAASMDDKAASETAAQAVAVESQGERKERRATSRSSQELVRVKAKLLDNMVNFAGEVSIYRSRLEQQIGAYRFNLTEMEQTVSRVREQLRKLEIETEAQILFRYETEGTTQDEDFDPLEMDRYSQMQQLSRSMMESVSDLSSIQSMLENITRESETLLLQQSRVNTELQEGLMRTRMVPFTSLAARLRRIVRQTAQELGKKVELELSGAEGEMDRTVVDRIIAPVEHMLRNAISHGIEMPEQRRKVGKAESGTIRITLERESSDVVLRIADDGAGMNLNAIRNKAIQRGMMDASSDLSDNEILQFILETGFSTAESVTQVAGRGVGMDVVNSEVKQLGGSLHIDSELGKGASFTVRLPFTLALNQALLVEVGEDTYAIPLSSIEGIVRMRLEELNGYYDDPTARFSYAGAEYEVRHLGSLLGTGKPHLDSAPKRVPLLLARVGDHAVAFHIENLLGSREIVVKSVGPQISAVKGISGATILGDGSVVMILDVAELLRGGASLAMAQVEDIVQQSLHTEAVTVMVVDDSITVRKVTSRLLERNDMNVITAKDGVDAVSKLREHIPDIMLLDIEMPRMDGFELATHVRNESRLRSIPIIMITSRTGDKHRQRAMQIGVNRYLGKPFQEAELMENIRALLEEQSANG
jgi:chemosensory pili system protein ChpA (sensor histidine kinase/response regulator)